MARPRCTKMVDCPIPPSIAHDHVPGQLSRPTPVEGKRVLQLSEFGSTLDEARKNADRLVAEGLIQYVGKRSFSLTEAGERKERELAEHNSFRSRLSEGEAKPDLSEGEAGEEDDDVAGDNEAVIVED